jgi:hypothetical protein
MTFEAPWGTRLKLLTALVVIGLVGVSIASSLAVPQHDDFLSLIMVASPLVVLLITALFMVRGYILTREALLIRRLGWDSKVALAGLISAEADPKAMAGSMRIFGNGGLFCIVGLFRNKKLGAYRAYATEPRLSVVLKFAKRTIVVTPDRPERFVARIRELGQLREMTSPGAQ